MQAALKGISQKDRTLRQHCPPGSQSLHREPHLALSMAGIAQWHSIHAVDPRSPAKKVLLKVECTVKDLCLRDAAVTVSAHKPF